MIYLKLDLQSLFEKICFRLTKLVLNKSIMKKLTKINQANIIFGQKLLYKILIIWHLIHSVYADLAP